MYYIEARFSETGLSTGQTGLATLSEIGSFQQRNFLQHFIYLL